MGTHWRGMLDRGSRRFGTGLSFVVFGVGGTLLSVTLFPFLRLISPNGAVAQRRIGAAMRRVMGLFIWFMKSLGLLTYELHGLERLARSGQLIVANHPTLIDVVFMVWLTPEAGCVVKRALWRNPALRWPVIWAGYIPNTEGVQLVQDCSRVLESGRSLLVFPEGTRTVPGQPLALKRGAAQVALASGADVLPVTIVCDPPFLTKGSHWYQVPPRRPHFTITVGQPIPRERYGAGVQSHPLVARELTAHLATYFTRNIDAVLNERRDPAHESARDSVRTPIM
ncbi:MAG TPA: lysophospholipid acyltransferase family protein [Steroidobacteraceae bacterium]